MVITSIGQVGIKTPTKKYVLTPSLAAIASLANPVEVYSKVTAPGTPLEERVEAVHAVLLACSDCDTLKDYLGPAVVDAWVDEKGRTVKKYRQKYIDDATAACLAESLLFHGMVGKVQFRKRVKSSDKSGDFDPLQWMALAVARLEISEREAWGMTMTSIMASLRAKFPPSEKESALENFSEEGQEEFKKWYASMYGAGKL